MILYTTPVKKVRMSNKVEIIRNIISKLVTKFAPVENLDIVKTRIKEMQTELNLCEKTFKTLKQMYPNFNQDFESLDFDLCDKIYILKDDINRLQIIAEEHEIIMQLRELQKEL